MQLKLYNTQSKSKEVFTPIAPPLVTMYNCGPTVYHYAHIGNLRGYVNAHILRNLLEYHGYEVRQVINITDVGHLISDGDEGEDKIEKGVRREGKGVGDIISHYTQAFMDDLKDLNIDPDALYALPKATEHISEQIELIKRLEKGGYTYTTNTGVYFDTSRYPDYAAFAELDLKNLKEGARVSVTTEKRNGADFALWKFSGKEQRLQEWDSPWGVGFPGWHIECSAMAMKYLGETLDIHTGGVDHIPVHHTNEIAQSTCATGKLFSRFWIHHEFISVKDSKMSKSKDNFIRLQTLKDAGYHPFDYRYLLLQTHYRMAIQFSFDALEAAQNALRRLIRIVDAFDTEGGILNKEYENLFLAALNDDLGTPEALGIMWEYIKSDDTDPNKRVAILFSMSLLGIDIEILRQETEIIVPEDIKTLGQKRQQAKETKDYATADKLRDEIAERGFTIKDTPDGFVFEKMNRAA